MEDSVSAESNSVGVVDGEIIGNEKDKVFNDPVHGPIRIPALCISIIDTPQFQRLRRIQQLGGVSYVYYGATHTRFEHSIGVCYLAGKLLEHLQKEQPELGIDKRDMLCVQVAGLCHDLGHGPFSHLWDKRILKEFGHPKLTHEELSEKMFDHLLKENQLEEKFREHLEISADKEEDRKLQTEFEFIKELIRGAVIEEGSWEMKGREEPKAFLYNIISNKANGIDVDKWDYFARDCYYLGIKNSFDHLRLMNFARVLTVSDPPQNRFCQICYRDKEVYHVYVMFYARNLLHQKAYQHKTVKAIECMLADAIISAKDLLEFRGQRIDDNDTESAQKKLKDVVEDMAFYEKLDDTVISIITHMDLGQCSDNSLEKAQSLIRNLEKRNIYRCFSSKPIDREKMKEYTKPNSQDLDVEKVKDDFIAVVLRGEGGYQDQDLKEDVRFESVTYDYGMKDENPVDKVYFYKKSDPNTAINIPKNEVSMMLPVTFKETRLLMIFKNLKQDDKNRSYMCAVKEMFEKFCETFTQQSETSGI